MEDWLSDVSMEDGLSRWDVLMVRWIVDCHGNGAWRHDTILLPFRSRASMLLTCRCGSRQSSQSVRAERDMFLNFPTNFARAEPENRSSACVLLVGEKIAVTLLIMIWRIHHDMVDPWTPSPAEHHACLLQEAVLEEVIVLLDHVYYQLSLNYFVTSIRGMTINGLAHAQSTLVPTKGSLSHFCPQ